MSTQKNKKIIEDGLTYSKIYDIMSTQTQTKERCKMLNNDTKKTAAEKLAAIISQMSETDINKILYLIEGIKIGENISPNKPA